MDIYNSLWEQTKALLPQADKCRKYDAACICEEANKAELILQRDAAFELGGSALPALNATFFIDENFEDEVYLFGKDLSQLCSDCAFARIAVLRIAPSESSEENAAYKQLKEIELSKFRVFPKGYMPRLSPSTGREQVRVSKQAVADCLSFYNIGCSYIREYKKNPAVLGVKILFVTLPDIDWKALEINTKKAAKLTETLNTIYDGLSVSCDTCSLKPLCDEVEGLRELHFKEKGK